jgi:U3 small nucleolar RNA-associated protein 11
MQRLMMGKGGRKKLHGIEKVEADEDEDDDDSDDVADRKTSKPVDEKAYKPRVYKWRMERKR